MRARGLSEALQRLIDTTPTKNLADAVKLHRLGAYVDDGQTARLLAVALAVVEKMVVRSP